VLPFENFFDHRNDDYFSRGFVEDLITDLAHFQSLQVISSYSSQKIGAEAHNSIDVARELAIDYLLKGNLHLNPYRNTWYYPYGAFTYFVQGSMTSSLRRPDRQKAP